MSDRDRLNAVIARFQADQNILVPNSSTPVELLTGLLRLIDETVLPREIQIQAASDRFVLQVAKRRLFAVSGCISAEMADGQTDELVSLGQEISRVLLGKELKVDLSRLSGEFDQSAVGTSVDMLAAAWAGLEEKETTTFEDLSALKSLAKISWLEGEEIERSGLNPSSALFR